MRLTTMFWCVLPAALAACGSDFADDGEDLEEVRRRRRSGPASIHTFYRGGTFTREVYARFSRLPEGTLSVQVTSRGRLSDACETGWHNMQPLPVATLSHETCLGLGLRWRVVEAGYSQCAGVTADPPEGFVYYASFGTLNHSVNYRVREWGPRGVLAESSWGPPEASRSNGCPRED